MMSSPRTIAVFNHHHLGDLLGSFPALLALRHHWPQARIINIAPPLPLSLLEHSSLTDASIALFEGVRGDWRALCALRRAQPDLAVCFSGTRRVALMARLCGAPKRVGFAPIKHDWAWTDKVSKVGPPALQHDLSLVESLGCPAMQRNYVGLLGLTEAERATAARWLQEQGLNADAPLIGLNMGASVGRRRWGIENFAAVARDLGGSGAQLIAFGGPQDRDAVNELQALAATPLIIAAGKFAPRASAALMERCALMVTGDTGPMHLAIAVNTPVVALFGPVPAAYRLPAGYSHIGLEHNAECLQLPQPRCRYQKGCTCLRSITPQEVVEAAQTLLRQDHERPQSFPIETLSPQLTTQASSSSSPPHELPQEAVR